MGNAYPRPSVGYPPLLKITDVIDRKGDDRRGYPEPLVAHRPRDRRYSGGWWFPDTSILQPHP